MATFQSIYTVAGLTKLAASATTGTPINLTAVAVGDGNGNPTIPSDSQTVLVRERYRAAPNRIYQDPADPTIYVAELVIPAVVGGFTLREVGVFDADGVLFVVGNLPETYKPAAIEGSFADTIINVRFVVSNSASITLQVDPNVIVATRTWVLNTVTACQILPGGTTGQILRKKSNACGDTEWADPTDANVVVNTIEEQQTLAAAQTVVDLALTNTYGLAVFIEGVRLRDNQWTPHPTIQTRLTLAAAYPAGSRFTAVQNEPTASTGAPLLQAQNLADLPSKPTARTNLGVPSIAEANQRGPAGMVAAFAGSTAPTGWLKANGAAVSRTAYATLFAYIGVTYGAGDGFNTFNLPDLRGEFIRGWDDGRSVDTGRAFGSFQADELKAHSHALPRDQSGSQNVQSLIDSGNSDEGITEASQTGLRGGAETRPRNRALLYCIKF